MINGHLCFFMIELHLDKGLEKRTVTQDNPRTMSTAVFSFGRSCSSPYLGRGGSIFRREVAPLWSLSPVRPRGCRGIHRPGEKCNLSHVFWICLGLSSRLEKKVKGHCLMRPTGPHHLQKVVTNP